MKLSRSLVLASAVALGLSAFTGGAQARPSMATCSGGDIASGTYHSLRVTGDCTVPAGAVVTIYHGLRVARGASLSADSAPSTISVGGNVYGRPGSFVGLGCTEAHGCESGGDVSHVTVGGSILLDHVFDAAINGVEVDRNVVSRGGGAGFVFKDGGFIPFSVKDDVIHGNLMVRQLKTTWFGVIRSTIDGNVVLSRIQNDDPDGNEVVHDTIGGNLVCRNMSPHPQFGDADDGAPPGYQYSTVGGQVIGQCDFVLAPK